MQAQLTNLYYGLLNRAPDENGFEFWLDHLDRGTLSFEKVVESFLSSREFVTAQDTNTANRAFVEMVYDQVLDRSSDDAGRGYWLAQLDAGLSRAGFVAGVIQSDEFTSEQTLTLDFVPGAYEASSFQYGIASGDPTSESVILWTHLTTDSAEDVVTVQVATDESFDNLIGEQTATARASQDHTVKIDYQGLNPGTEYYYRFVTSDGETSSIGRTKTLPSGDVSQVDLAVFSCANYPAGFFNPYAEAAVRKDYDALIHLGDYIYEYGVGEYATENAAEYGRMPSSSTI